ncbi:MAG: universal stress protein [Streptosporangiales bacterium]|nr:universal stress protein [Streptosporangiales bacterium]
MTGGLRPVVACVDGSAEALRAVEWAAGRAARGGLPLRIVHAHLWPLMHVPLGAAPGVPEVAGLDARAEAIRDEAVDRAEKAGMSPDATVIVGFRIPVLLDESRDAERLVIGSRGLGGVGSVLLGSTGVELAARAASPVTVVKGGGAGPVRGPDRIVVGYDGSGPAERALDYAFAEARATEVPLVVVRALGRTDETGRLEEALAVRRAAGPEVVVSARQERGNPAGLLLAEADENTEIVVGSRGRGGFRGMLLGSVSQGVLHHAACVVTVVPHPEDVAA